MLAGFVLGKVVREVNDAHEEIVLGRNQSFHLKCIIKDMEKVQKFAIKVCLKQWDYSISYFELLKQADLPTLGQRRVPVCTIYSKFCIL